MKKLLASLLLILLVISTLLVLTACDNTPDNPPAESDSDSTPSDSESTGDTEGSGELATHKVIENGVVQYTIIRAENASKAMKASITHLYNYFTERSSEFINYETDESLDYLETGAHDPDALEIVIGDTNYEKSQELMSTLNYGEYAIEAAGKKIYVVSPTDTGIDAALNILIYLFDNVYDEDAGQLHIPSEDLKRRKTFDERLAAIPAVDNGQYEFSMNGGDGSEMLVFKKSSLDTYNNYVATLTEMGYEEYIRNDNFGDNKYVMFTKGDTAVNVLYTKADSMIRIILDDLAKTVLPKIKSDYTPADKICDTFLMQVGVAPKDGVAQNGQCYLIRCEDGKFIIVDGGFGWEEADVPTPRENIRRIYELLKEHTPDGMTPTVACWIFTHEHADHTYFFESFAKKYNNEVKVEQFVYNYPLLNVGEEAFPRRDQVRQWIDYFKGAEVVKAHPGQVFQYANIKMEVLYSVELLWPTKMTTLNNASLITRFFIGDQSILMPGDMDIDANPICIKYIGKYLKSDFYQITHHGCEGDSTAFSKLVDPTWVLWPMGERGYHWIRENMNAGAWLHSSESNVKEFFYSFFSTTIFYFPFDGTNYTITENTVYSPKT